MFELEDYFKPNAKTGKPYCAMCEHFIGEVRHGWGSITGHCEFSKSELKTSSIACKKHYLPHNRGSIYISWNFKDYQGGFDIKEWKETGEVVMHPDRALQMRKELKQDAVKRGLETRRRNAEHKADKRKTNRDR